MTDIRLLEEKIGYVFSDKRLLLKALTHSSYANDVLGDAFLGNERLEFLGDAVLELAVSLRLYALHPEMPEGKLSRFRAALVCEESLAAAAEAIGLPDFLLLGKGEEHTGGRNRDSVISDALEAVIGAAALDGGNEAGFRIVYRLFSEAMEGSCPEQFGKDSKSLLQEKMQKSGHLDISYRIVEETGPDHCKVFTAAVLSAGIELGRGSGKNKKAAEAAAAAAALDNMR